jgi:hypothetical protein
MIADPLDRKALLILGWILVLVAGADGLSTGLHLKWLQQTEWPTDLYGQQVLGLQASVGVVGSSRSHYALPPSALSTCLSSQTGKKIEVRAAERMRASAYAIDITARDVFADTPILIAEVAPESVSAHHFEHSFNVTANADAQDVPECLAHRDDLPVTDCLRPLFRGVENIAFLLHRPWTDHRHIEWMSLYYGGGQYCYDTPECLARNATYDQENAARWDSRVQSVLPTVAPLRFAHYEIGGLSGAHFVAMLQRAHDKGQQLWLVNLPVHTLYQARIPPQDYALWLDWTRQEAQAFGAHFLDYNTPEWEADRSRFLDPDHLNSVGALQLAEAVCGEVSPALH